MAVRAKFRVQEITRSQQYRATKNPDGTLNWTKQIPCEKQTVKLTPVFSDDPNSENRRFWEATPSGGISLDMINQEAFEAFELNAEYFVDFTKAQAS